MMSGVSVYWGRRDKSRDIKGIVVLFAWSSIHQKQLSSFVHLYSSLGWNSLVSHADFLSAFDPNRAMSLAYVILRELIEVLKVKTCPVVFVVFSGGPKACMYKLFQIIQGTCEGQLDLEESRLIRNCISGHIYDSSPLDFASDLNAQFTLHPAIRKMPGPSKLFAWVVKGVASGLDGLYLTRFESQRAEYWHALYSSVEFGAPFLILCSETDDLAPYPVIVDFVKCIQDLGGDIKIVKWSGSPHLEHYRRHPIQYTAAVTNFLEQAVSVYIHRIQQLRERMGMHDQISELICDLQKSAVNSNQSLTRVAVSPSDHFFLPSSAEYHSSQGSGSLQKEQRERSICLPEPPSLNAHSVLGKVLFDVCVPKNVEGWDVRFSGSRKAHPSASDRKHPPFFGFKCNRRSRL